jgi:glycosyltransferase 2 family protein
LAGIDWRWVGLAMICFVLSYVVQAVRWQLLLEPVGRIRLLEAAQAIFVGLFTNEVLPMRAGESEMGNALFLNLTVNPALSRAGWRSR